MILLVLALAVPASAMDFTAPEVPQAGQSWMPDRTDSFGQGMLEILREAASALTPELAESGRTCFRLLAAALLLSLLRGAGGMSGRAVSLAGTVAVAGLLLQPTSSMIRLAAETVARLSDYGKLLLPVMTGAMAAQGGVTASAALYAGTAFFDAVLSAAVAGLLVPLIYFFLALSVANAALGEGLLQQLAGFVKWLVTWLLRLILYLFTGYLAVTGVVSGSADAAALRAAKLTISNMVPVVGGILADASETVLVSAGLMKNAAGIYGLLAVTAVWIGPFLKIGVLYLLLKLTGAVCGTLTDGGTARMIQDFSAAMGLLLAMTGTVSLLLMVSTVCFLKGAG